MALQDLLVHLDSTTGSLQHLRLAADLARRNDSCLTALYMPEWSETQLAHRRTAELAGRPLADVEAFDSHVAASLALSGDELRAELEGLGARLGLQVEWRVVAGEPGDVLLQQLRHADLCILDVNLPTASGGIATRLCEELLFSAGRPVLLLPKTSGSATLGAHVAIGWNGSRSASRALNDALPILEHCDRTTLIAINPGEFSGAQTLPGALKHLGRHGVTTECIEIDDVASAAVADTLQQRAVAIGADLLVAGAHGHNWPRELLLGSVTRDLLAHLQLPLLTAH
ncbi:MAG TPA: universal stress protein [Steroidobacteraceae bacterium]|jgi:nucleotide-binding universal stress UspA family protein|nr:universal stress protein [Steroidobacteraceae bacterium]